MPTACTLTLRLEQDGSGTVDISEYVQWALRDALDNSRGRVLDLFREWDEDRSVFIDRKEFGAALKSMGFKCSKEDVKKIFSGLDPDGSGQLEYAELNATLRKLAGTTLTPAKKTEKPEKAKAPAGANKPASKGRR